MGVPEESNMFRAALCLAMLAVALAAPATMTLTLDQDWLKANANSTHYEDPKPNGCLSDEQAIQIQGVSGDFCTPKCTGILKMSCPQDLPDGVTAKPSAPSRTSPATNTVPSSAHQVQMTHVARLLARASRALVSAPTMIKRYHMLGLRL